LSANPTPSPRPGPEAGSPAARPRAPRGGVGPEPRAPVTLIVTVRNEERSIDALLDSVLSGRRAPDEIVVVDGGSSDRTLALLRARAARDARLQVHEHPGSIAAGRNAAVRVASHDLIACTDAGVIVEPEWLERIAGRLESEPPVDAVAGFYRAVGATPFERAAAVVSAPVEGDVDPARFLPSARSLAFTRAAWMAVGGFDESLTYAEDTWFALALRRGGHAMAFEPSAVVRWRPRGDLRSFARQYGRYGWGDGGARIRGSFYATLALKYLLAVVLVALGFRFPLAWAALAAGIAAFAASQARRGIGRVRTMEAIALVPFLKVVYDGALLGGYARGRVGPRLRPPEGPSRAPGIPRVSG
jgi:glycosyltransferase involved in cell wall biosynthesis